MAVDTQEPEARERTIPVGTILRVAVPIAVAAVIWFLPVPSTLGPDGEPLVAPEGMHMLAIFVGTIVALITQPLPTAPVTIIGLAVAMITKTMPLDGSPPPALAGFANTTVWLIVAAFFISEGFLITGLGRRIALHFVRRLGRSSLGLAYGMAATDLLLAPATPSNTARAGGVVYPIVRSLALLEGSTPDTEESRKRLGSYLMMTMVIVNTVTSAMFVTAMAGNPVAVDLAATLDPPVDISWGSWALAAVVPGVVSLLAVPLLMYRLYPPVLKATPAAPAHAREELDKLGPVSRNEWLMIATFVLLLGLWVLSDALDVNATATAFVGIAILLVTRVLTWKDMAANHSAWQTLIFFGVLVGMATYLNTLGVIPWIGQEMSDLVEGTPWLVAFGVLSLVYFYVHYLFASNTAQITAMYAVFLATSIAAGAPPLFAALALGYIGNLFGALTHYASGPCGVIAGSGYVAIPEWFRIAFIMSIPIILIWTTVGGGWMYVIGLWD
jgi:DASS family divalent anion:Na+ symporter